MLFYSCERDEAQKPNIEMLSQQAAMDLFFKDYSKKEDELRDKVVERLLAVNDSSGIIYDLTNKYGQPKWFAKQSRTTKSDSYLVVPICVPKADSVSAVFVFLEQDSTLRLKIFEASNPDTLISSFILHYQCSLFPNKKYTRFTIPVKENSKDYIRVTSCWYDLATGDFIHFNVTEVTCTEKIVYLPTLEVGLGDNGDDGGSTGGAGGGIVAPESIPSTARDFTVLEKKALAELIEKLINDWCPNSTVTAGWNSVRFMLDATLKDAGRYYSSMNTIILRADATNADLLHEIFHNYQNIFYGGISKYKTKGKVNIEFETWMFIDIYLARNRNELKFSKYIKDADTKERWRDWINDIVKYGFTDSNSAFYQDWVDIFNTYMPEYKSEKDISLSTPRATITALNCLTN